MLRKKFKAIQLSHLDDYCTIMIGAGRIGLIMLKYVSSLMEHFPTFLFSFVWLDSQAVGFMDVYFFLDLFSRCRYEVCLFLKLCSFQVNVWHKYTNTT